MSIYGDGQWLVSTKIDLTPRSDNGKINSSPVTRSPAIVRFQEGCPKEIRIPVEDPDGDVVKCRWASVAESAIPSDSFPYGVLKEVSLIFFTKRIHKFFGEGFTRGPIARSINKATQNGKCTAFVMRKSINLIRMNENFFLEEEELGMSERTNDGGREGGKEYGWMDE